MLHTAHTNEGPAVQVPQGANRELPGLPRGLLWQHQGVLRLCSLHHGHSCTDSQPAGWMDVQSQTGHYQKDLTRSSGPTLQQVGVLLMMLGGPAF
jgi:hypothetical protein